MQIWLTGLFQWELRSSVVPTCICSISSLLSSMKAVNNNIYTSGTPPVSEAKAEVFPGANASPSSVCLGISASSDSGRGVPGCLTLSTGGRDLYRYSRWHARLVLVLLFRVLPSRCGWTTVCGPSAPSSTPGWLPHVGVIVPTSVNATATAQELEGDHSHQSRVRQRPYSTDRLCRSVAWLCFYVLCWYVFFRPVFHQVSTDSCGCRAFPRVPGRG